MSKIFASTKLNQLTEHIQFNKLTEFVSVDHYDGNYRRYGTLQFQKGQLRGVKYFHLQGSKALEKIQSIAPLSASFAKGAVVLQTISQNAIITRQVA